MQHGGHERQGEVDAQVASFAIGLPLAPEEEARANLYALLARLLLAPPDTALLADLAGAATLAPGSTPGDTAEGEIALGQSALAAAWHTLSLTARLLPPELVADEYNELFISTAAPRISPHASIYLAGFLHEKPLAQLRADLAGLGLGRRAGAGETEDHLGALCEAMRQLIVGRRPLAQQQAFFETHLASWAGVCLAQLARADGARLYARVAQVAEAFFAVEAEAFAVMDALPLAEPA